MQQADAYTISVQCHFRMQVMRSVGHLREEVDVCDARECVKQEDGQECDVQAVIFSSVDLVADKALAWLYVVA
jgi:hypothetical protein